MSAPTWSRKILSWIVPPARRDDVLGDLVEIHHRRRQRYGDSLAGRARAWLGTSAESLLLILAFLLCRLQELDLKALGFSWLEFRLGLRLIKKQPLVALTAILALGMGIGISTTGFTFIDAVWNGQLPYENGDRFVRLEARTMPQGRYASLGHERYQLFREADSLEYLGAYDREEAHVQDTSGNGESVIATWITPTAFRHLPDVPMIGRQLTFSDGELGAPRVIVLRQSFWQRWYNGRRDVIGETLDVEGKDYTVVGVLPDSAGFPANGEIWLPLDETYLGGTPKAARRGLTFFGILGDTVTRTEANREIAQLSAQFEAQHSPEKTLRLQWLGFTEAHPQEKATSALATGVLIVLLVIIASNVANLVLARTASRSSELAMRTALGAARARLITQLAVEVLLLGIVGAGLGLFASQLALRWLAPLLEAVPFWMDLRISPRILLFAALLALLASIVGGVFPAIRATRRDPVLVLRSADRSVGHFGLGRAGATMMVVEMAVAVGMLSGALAIGRGLVNTPSYDLPEGKILTAFVIGDEQPDLGRLIVNAVEQLPEVTSVGIGRTLPGQDVQLVPTVLRPGTSVESVESRSTPVASIRPGYFETLETRPLAGRLFQASDMSPEAPPVAIVNESFVDKIFAGRNPIGQRLGVASGVEEPSAWREIVGVVPDLGLGGGVPDLAAGYYVPQATNSRAFYLMLRTGSEPSQLVGPLHRALAELGQDIRISRVLPLEKVHETKHALVSGFGATLVALGVAVLLLSLVSIYAMVSFAVARRTREIGIRVALGASRRQVLQKIAEDANRYLLVGGVLGLAMALAFSRIQDSLLDMRLPANEPWLAILVALSLWFAGAVACWVPAQRALRIEPTEALRNN